MHACHTQNGSGYRTFFRIQTLAKTVWPPLSSSRHANSVAVVVGGRSSSAVDAGERACIDIILSCNCGLCKSKRQSNCGGAAWMRGLHRRAILQLFPSASLPAAFHCEQISFLSQLTFAILRHFSCLPNPNSTKCDFWDFDKLPTKRMWPQRWLGFSMPGLLTLYASYTFPLSSFYKNKRFACTTQIFFHVKSTM